MLSVGFFSSGKEGNVILGHINRIAQSAEHGR